MPSEADKTINQTPDKIAQATQLRKQINEKIQGQIAALDQAVKEFEANRKEQQKRLAQHMLNAYTALAARDVLQEGYDDISDFDLVRIRNINHFLDKMRDFHKQLNNFSNASSNTVTTNDKAVLSHLQGVLEHNSDYWKMAKKEYRSYILGAGFLFLLLTAISAITFPFVPGVSAVFLLMVGVGVILGGTAFWSAVSPSYSDYKATSAIVEAIAPGVSLDNLSSEKGVTLHCLSHALDNPPVYDDIPPPDYKSLVVTSDKPSAYENDKQKTLVTNQGGAISLVSEISMFAVSTGTVTAGEVSVPGNQSLQNGEPDSVWYPASPTH